MPGNPRGQSECDAILEDGNNPGKVIHIKLFLCVLMKGSATGDMPNKLFSERSRGKSIAQ